MKGFCVDQRLGISFKKCQHLPHFNHFLHRKLARSAITQSRLLPEFGVHSTQMLREIYNAEHLNSYFDLNVKDQITVAKIPMA